MYECIKTLVVKQLLPECAVVKSVVIFEYCVKNVVIFQYTGCLLIPHVREVESMAIMGIELSTSHKKGFLRPS